MSPSPNGTIYSWCPLGKSVISLVLAKLFIKKPKLPDHSIFPYPKSYRMEIIQSDFSIVTYPQYSRPFWVIWKQPDLHIHECFLNTFLLWPKLCLPFENTFAHPTYPFKFWLFSLFHFFDHWFAGGIVI